MKKNKEIRSLWYRERVKYIETKRDRKKKKERERERERRHEEGR